MKNLKHLVDKHRDVLNRFAAQLREMGGGNVLGWTLYAAVVEEHVAERKLGVQSVVMLETIDVELLRRLGGLGREYGREGLAAPLIMSPEFLRTSLDTFPLEWIEIQQAHLPMFGPDYFTDLTFADRDVRLQCERELDVLQIGLQQGLLSASGIEDRLASLQHDWLRALLRALRGMLWLKGHKERLSPEHTLKEIAGLVNHPLDGLRQIVARPNSPGWQAFRELHADVEALRTAVDGW